MKISVVIVNYNVAFFLEQCLNSSIKALEKVSGEIIVVDNNSIDNSLAMMREKFPHIRLIANKENLGFSKANNLAIQEAKGEYVLLLNPDTVVEEDTFRLVVDFMDAHPEAGGLGVRMLDGKGRFLPESKRGLPTPAVAFYKIVGLSKLFPKSKRFGRYHLGYLSEFETHEIEILSGAFMLMRKSCLDKVGLLDEQFFMYGEDIDLSYRILLGGYKNYYFPQTRIIHYKGESTKKSSVNYVFVFYRAMVIFAQKHFSQKNAKLFSFLINQAIYFRASVAIMIRFLKKSVLPALDFCASLSLLYLLSHVWAKYGTVFPEQIIHFSLPLYSSIWLLSCLYCSAYDATQKISTYLFGIVSGTFLILILYALLPKSWQFSRLYILIGAGSLFFYFLLSRIILHFSLGGKFQLNGSKNKSFVVVGDQEEAERVKKVVEQSHPKIERIDFVSPNDEKYPNAIACISQLDQIVHIHKIDEVIFCAKDNTAHTIITWMSKINSAKIDFKIAQPDSVFIIGSNSIHKNGEMYMLDINAVTKTSNRRNKRTFDLFFSFFFLAFFPFNCWFYKNKKKLIKNLAQVFINKRSVVGYAQNKENKDLQLPKLKPGILNPLDLLGLHFENIDFTQKLNLIYARDYNLLQDLRIIQKAWKKLDR